MGQLGRLDQNFTDGAGNAITGATVNLYREGATVNGNQSGTSPLTVTVRAPGKIASGDTAALTTSPTVGMAVDAVTATTIVLSGFAGTLTLTDKQRLFPTNAQPAIYTDDQGGASTTWPLTTDSLGRISAWMNPGAYEVALTNGGVTTFFQGEIVVGEAPAILTSGVLDGATAVAHILDTYYQFVTAGAKLLSLRNQAIEKAFLDYLGNATVANATVVNLSASGTLSVTGASTLSGGITGPLTINSGGVAVTAGDITALASLINAKRLSATGGTTLANGDFQLSSGWGNTASVDVTGFGLNPTDKDTRGIVTINCLGSGVGASPFVTLTFKDGAFAAKPFAMCVRSDNSAPFAGAGGTTNNIFSVDAAGTSTTQLKIFFYGTPVAGNTYSFSYLVLG